MTTQPQRRRVEYTLQFQQLLADLATNQLKLEENQLKLEQTVANFLGKEKQVIALRNRFVTWGIGLSLLASVASLVISIIR